MDKAQVDLSRYKSCRGLSTKGNRERCWCKKDFRFVEAKFS